MKKIFAFMMLSAMLVGVLAGCAQTTPEVVVQTVEVPKEVVTTVEVLKTVEVVKEAEPAAVEPQGTLRVALTSEPTSLYIPLTADKMSDIAASQLYDPLVFQDDDLKIGPGLAESWEFLGDGSEVIFNLRKGVTFHNGEPFTADDVIATWEYGKKGQWPEKYDIATSVEKIDDYTIKVTTDGPKPLLLVTMHDFWSIIPNEYMEQVGVDGFQQKPIGTGPFMFVEWVKGDHITYKANPNYWREGLPKVAEVIFRIIPESATRVAALQSDEIDVVTRLSAEEAESLLGAPGIQTVKYPVARVYYVAFDNLSSGKGTPIEDPRVRQAMNYAVDVDAILKALFNGFGKRSTGFVATGELGYGIVDPFPYDPEKAKQLLAEAGYPNGFTISMGCPSGAYSHIDEVCQALVSYMADVGITIELEMMEPGHFWDLMAKKELTPLAVDAWADESGEAYNRMRGALGGITNAYSIYEDPEITKRLDAISVEIDREKRKALYEDLQIYMQENPPFIYLYEPVTFEAIRDRVQDYRPRPSEIYYLMNTWIASQK